MCSVEGEAPSSETGTSLDSPSAYPPGPITHSSALSPEHYENPYGLYSIAPGQQRARRPKLQHSTSILRKQAEEEAIKRSRSLSESYELSSDLQDKQVFELCYLVCVCQLGEGFSSSASVGTFNSVILCPMHLPRFLEKSVKDMLILLKVKTVLGTEIFMLRESTRI